MGATIGIFNGAMNLGFVVAPVIGGIAFTYWGIKPVFYGAGIVRAGRHLYSILPAPLRTPPPGPGIPCGDRTPGTKWINDKFDYTYQKGRRE